MDQILRPDTERQFRERGVACADHAFHPWLLWALVTRRLRLKGSPRLLTRFGKCFPAARVRRRGTEVRREFALARPRYVGFLRNDEETGRIR